MISHFRDLIPNTKVTELGAIAGRPGDTRHFRPARERVG
jgi:hypothetical protein